MIVTAAPQRRRLFLGLVRALLIGCVACLLFQNAGAATGSESSADDQLNPDLPEQTDKFPAHLYYADRNNSYLKSEQRVMHRPQDAVEFAKTIVAALIKGPQKGLVRTIPAGTELHAVYIDPENVCYVDFSGAVKKNHPGGINSELLTIFSVVNSLILNVSEIDRVKILIDGSETSTLAGHINLQVPFKAHMLLIR
jgi:hypothetical protein